MAREATTQQYLVTPGRLFLSPRPSAERFLRNLEELRLPGVEAWTAADIAQPSADLGEGKKSVVQFVIGCCLAPGTSARAVARAMIQELDESELEWAEELILPPVPAPAPTAASAQSAAPQRRSGSEGRTSFSSNQASDGGQAAQGTGGTGGAGGENSEDPAVAAVVTPRSSNRSSRGRPTSADGSRSRASRTLSGAPSSSSRGLKHHPHHGLDEKLPSWPHPGSKHPGVPTEWDAPSPRTTAMAPTNTNTTTTNATTPVRPRSAAVQRPRSAGPSAGGRVRTSNNVSTPRIRPVLQRPQSASASSSRRNRSSGGNATPSRQQQQHQESMADVIGLVGGEYPVPQTRARPQSASDAMRNRPIWNSRFHLDIKAEQGLRFVKRHGETNQVRPAFNVMSMRNRAAPSRMELALNIANDLSPSWRKHVLTERVVSGGRVRISEMLATQPYEDDRDAMPCSRGLLVEKIVSNDPTAVRGAGGGKDDRDASELLYRSSDPQTTVSLSCHMRVRDLRAVAKLLEDRTVSRALGKDRIVCCPSKDGFELSPPLHQVLPRMDLDAVLELVLTATEDESLRVLMENRSKRPPATSGSTNDALPTAGSATAAATAAATATPSSTKRIASRQQQQQQGTNNAKSSPTLRKPTRPTSATSSGRRRKMASSGGRHLSSSGNGSKNHVQREPMSLMERKRAKDLRATKSKSVRDAEVIYAQPYPGHEVVDALV
jgi:hypothetical protein